jgi:hypothetical protein
MCILINLHPSPARAALGESEDTIENDRKAISGVAIPPSPTSHPFSTLTTGGTNDAYHTQIIQTDAYTLTEYINEKGIIFGMAWRGIAHPDLSQLLGGYFDEFRAAQAHTEVIKGQHTHRLVQGSHVTIEKNGHMRAFRGRAYLLDLIPKSVGLDEIQ